MKGYKCWYFSLTALDLKKCIRRHTDNVCGVNLKPCVYIIYSIKKIKTVKGK
jgi:hypothetical protein